MNMRTIKRAAVLGVALSVAMIVAGGGAEADGPTARALLKNTDGQTIGVVRLIQQGDAVLVRAEASSLSEGFHGFHVHAGTACFDENGNANFGLALGHYTTGGAHGAHAGDMPSLLVMDDGTAEARFKTDSFDVADVTGRTIIVHAGRDNFGNIPTRYHSHTENVMGPDAATQATGDAGARTACGKIEATS